MYDYFMLIQYCLCILPIDCGDVDFLFTARVKPNSEIATKIDILFIIELLDFLALNFQMLLFIVIC